MHGTTVKKSRAIRLLPLWTFMACSSVNVTCTFTTAFLALRRTMLHQHNPQYGKSCACDRNSKRTL